MCADNESPHLTRMSGIFETHAVIGPPRKGREKDGDGAGHNPHLEPSHTAPLKAGVTVSTRRRQQIRYVRPGQSSEPTTITAQVRAPA